MMDLDAPIATVDLSPADRRTIDAVTAIVAAATTLDVTIATALNQLSQSVGGYPATTPGAAPADAQPTMECHHPLCTNTLPCELHEPAVQLTPPERLAGQRDKARIEQHQLVRRINRIRHDIDEAAKLSQRWGTSGIDSNTVRQRLNDALSTDWCNNCAMHGFNKKRSNGEYCEFCSGIKSRYKRYPNHHLCAMNDAGQRVMPSDVARAFKVKTVTVPEPASIADAHERRAKRIRGQS